MRLAAKEAGVTLSALKKILWLCPRVASPLFLARGLNTAVEHREPLGCNYWSKVVGKSVVATLGWRTRSLGLRVGGGEGKTLGSRDARRLPPQPSLHWMERGRRRIPRQMVVGDERCLGHPRHTATRFFVEFRGVA